MKHILIYNVPKEANNGFKLIFWLFHNALFETKRVKIKVIEYDKELDEEYCDFFKYAQPTDKTTGI